MNDFLKTGTYPKIIHYINRRYFEGDNGSSLFSMDTPILQWERQDGACVRIPAVNEVWSTINGGAYYNDTREQYYERLKMSSCEVCGELDFIEYALQGFVDALDSQINIILDEQLNITWENYIYNHCFCGKLTPSLRRRRDLLLEVSNFSQYMTLRELRYRLPDEILRQNIFGK